MSRQRIYAPLRVSVFGVRCGPAGVAVDARGFRVRPVSSELWRGKLSRFCLLPGGWVFCLWGGGSCRGFACCLVVGCFACGAGEGCRGLVRCLMAGCFACGAGESCRPFGLLLGGLVWAQESPPQL